MTTPKITETHRVKLLTAGWSPLTDRFYPKAVLKNVVDQFKTPSIGDFMFSGDYGNIRLNLENASHRTNRLYLNATGTELWADISILDTRCGNLLRDLHKTRNIRFDCFMIGKINCFSEVESESVQFLRVTAFAHYS